MTRSAKILLVITIGWGAFIFFNSSLPAEQSGEMSGLIFDRLLIFLKWMDADTLTRLIRKSAHLLEYAVFGGLTASVFWKNGSLSRQNSGNVLFPGLFLAVSDELLQTFVPGRSGEVRDVTIDFCGILIGWLVICLLALFFRRRQQPPKWEGI